MPVLAADHLNDELDRLAEHLEAHLDIESLMEKLSLVPREAS
jgi:hypothetical protein